MKQKLGLDIDGVLMNFPEHFYEWFDQPFVFFPRWEDPFIMENYKYVRDHYGFWRTMPHFEDTGIEKINFDCYITARGIPSELTHESLVKAGFPDKPVHTVHHLDSKVEICKELGITHFVDDRPKNCQELSEAGIKAYLWDVFCNRYFEWPDRIDYLTQVDPVFWK
jgi:FMN phosphatase YigB (HAD superfamily)